MKSATQLSLLALVTVSVSLSAWAQGQGIDYAKIEILTEKIAPNLYLLSGSAGADPARLPVVSYGMGDPVKLRLNGEIVDLIPVRAAHTGGDTMIRLKMRTRS